jgi:hypothetical protein
MVGTTIRGLSPNGLHGRAFFKTVLPLPLLLLLMCTLGCQNFSSAKRDTQKRLETSPVATFELMRTFERKGDFVQYVDCLTERGRGWLIANVANGLLMDANVQPVNPEAGAGSRAILQKYGMEDFVQRIRTWNEPDPDSLCLRIARTFGAKLPEFLKDTQDHFHRPFFPAFYVVASSSINGDRAEIVARDPEIADRFPDITSKVFFVRRNGKWVCDGGTLD